MAIGIKRLGIRKSPPALLVEFTITTLNSNVSSSTNTLPSTTLESLGVIMSSTSSSSTLSPLHHVVVELLAETVPKSSTDDEGAIKLAQNLRIAFPTLLPLSIVSDEKLISLLMALVNPTSKNVDSSRTTLISSNISSMSQQSPTTSTISTSTSSFLSSAIAGIGDLQRAKPAALQAAKARMDVVFDANRILPGMPGFIYDKRIDFNATEAAPSDWDDE
jgi:hypothetical protein